MSRIFSDFSLANALDLAGNFVSIRRSLSPEK
jgi:hypothetical protein